MGRYDHHHRNFGTRIFWNCVMMRMMIFAPTETLKKIPLGVFFNVEGGRLGDAFGGACSAPREPSESTRSLMLASNYIGCYNLHGRL